MFKRFLTLIILPVVILTSCGEDDPVPPTPPVEAVRTVLIYMAADNSLGGSGFDSQNITSIIQGSTEANLNGGNLLVYKDSRNADPQLIRMTPQGEEVIKEYPEHANSVSVATMQQILSEVKTDFPAKSYGLILWSHGSNWFPSSMHTTRAFGQDNNNWMELDELKKALPDHEYDFLIFDACYMAGIEVAYALKDKADYIVASPTEIMGSGMPYKEIIPYLFSAEANLEGLCDKFYNYYLNETNTPYATLSVISTAQLDNLAAATRNILKDNYSKTADINLRSLQRYFRSPYYGQYDFDDYINRIAPADDYAQFQTALKQAVVYEKHTASFLPSYGGYQITHFSGLSIYVPSSSDPAGVYDEYKKLDWYRAAFPQ